MAQGIFLTGFLGSGKTTLGIQLCAEALRKGVPVAYIVNDIGKENIDFERITRAIPGIDAADLSAACIGCNGQEELYTLLDEYHARGTFLFIEPTGILMGTEIQQIQHDVRDKWSLPVITLVNAYQFLNETSAIALAKEGLSQLASADVVGITWWNMLPDFRGIADERLLPLHELIGASTKAPVYLIPERITDGGLLETLMNTAPGDGSSTTGGEHHRHEDHPGHNHTQIHAESWHTRSVVLRPNIGIQELIEVLAPVIETVVRVKGDVGDQSFDCVGGVWNTSSLLQKGARKVVMISINPLPEGLLDKVSESSTELPQPVLADLENAVEYLFRNIAPLSPGGNLLPIDGQTYTAYGIAMKLPHGHELRVRAIHTIIERIIEACKVLRADEKHLPSTHRTTGAYLPYFALAHWEELEEDLQRRIVAARPVELLVKGLMPLTEIGPSTGITGGTVRPASLKNGAYRFAVLHEQDSVEPLVEAFRHCASVAIPEVRQEWENLINEI